MAGTSAGESAVLDLDDGNVAKQLDDMADDAWEHDGIPTIEEMFPAANLTALARKYTTAFVAAAKKRT